MKQFVRFFIMAALILAVSCKKEEVIAVTGISVTPNSLTIKEGESTTLSATITPSDAANQRVEWSSSNDDVAVVTAGKVIGRAAGNATITVRSEDGGKTATCAVKVESATISVVSVSLDKESLELTEGDSAELTATVKPDDASNKKVSWSSSDSSIATVENGKVTALKAGTAKITVTTDDGGKTATCEVTVNAAIVPVSGVSLDETSLELVEGETFTLTATVSPDDASNKNVTWKSSNSVVATVENGKISALKVGAAKITVITEDGSKTATCDVTVKAAIIAVSAISLDQTSLELIEGESATLTATIEPENASNKNYSWESSDAEIATVKDGKVTAVKAGTATITVKSEDGGKTASCKVTVTEAKHPVTGVTLNMKSIILTPGATSRLTATVMPEDADNKNVSWESSDTSIATVEDGKVTAVKVGTATITVTTEDGGKTATCDVTVKSVKVPVTNVSLNKSSIEMAVGESFTLTATITPSNATNQKLSWTGLSSTIASAKAQDNKYTITALQPGNMTITVTTDDGGKTASCDVTIVTFKGNGTSSNPYLITSIANMKTLSDKVNAGEGYYGKYFKLTNDLTINTGEVAPIGTASSPFMGNFGSNNSTINYIYQGREKDNDIALFGYTLKANISVKVKGDIIGGQNIACIVARASLTKFQNCVSSGSIIGSKFVGGIVGYSSECEFFSCQNRADIWASIGQLGGICGYSMNAKYSGCENSGGITGGTKTLTGEENTGGIVGYANSDGKIDDFIIKCSNSGVVRGGNRTGGIAGDSDTRILSCYNISSVIGTAAAGGIVGTNLDSVIGSFNRGYVTADATSGHAGGICGYQQSGVVKACYNRNSDIRGFKVGGIFGWCGGGSADTVWSLFLGVFGRINAGITITNGFSVTANMMTDGDMLKALNDAITNYNLSCKAGIQRALSLKAGTDNWPVLQ